LHASSIFEELATKSATHDVVELLLHKFVTILFNHILFALTNSTFATKSNVEGCFVAGMLG
jgi:hypothetical protein